MAYLRPKPETWARTMLATITSNTIGASSMAVEMSPTTLVELIPPEVVGSDALISLNIKIPTIRTILAVTSWMNDPAWSFLVDICPIPFVTSFRRVGILIAMALHYHTPIKTDDYLRGPTVFLRQL